MYKAIQIDMNMRKERRMVCVITDNEFIVIIGRRTILKERKRKKITRPNTMY